MVCIRVDALRSNLTCWCRTREFRTKSPCPEPTLEPASKLPHSVMKALQEPCSIVTQCVLANRVVRLPYRPDTTKSTSQSPSARTNLEWSGSHSDKATIYDPGTSNGVTLHLHPSPLRNCNHNEVRTSHAHQFIIRYARCCSRTRAVTVEARKLRLAALDEACSWSFRTSMISTMARRM
jgi:hypothetical protein